jgi:hypothetical protein
VRTEEKKLLIRENALKMKNLGVSMDFIVYVTGLSKEEIISL